MNPEVHKLLKLKRHETPGPDYFERFLDEFRDRQRAEMLQRPALSILWERIVGAFPDFHVPRLAYAGVGALALVLSGAILATQQSGGKAPATFALGAQAPTVNIMPSGQGGVRTPGMRSDQPLHYVLEARPVSYESPYSF